MPQPAQPPQLAQFPFAGGLDEKTDERHVAPESLISVSNMRFTKNGILERRPGNTYLTNQIGSGSMAHGKGKVMSYADALVVTDGNRIGEYSAATGKVTDKDRVNEVMISRSPLMASAISTPDTDIAVGNGVTLAASVIEDTASGTIKWHIFATVIDNASGAEIYSSFPIALSITILPRPRCCFVGNVGIIVWEDDTPRIRAITLSASYVWGAATNLVTDEVSTTSFEIAGMADRFALCYIESGASKLKVNTFDSALASLTVVTINELPWLITNGRWHIGAVGTTGETLWVTYALDAGNHNIRFIGLNPTTLATTVAATTLYATGGAELPFHTAVERVSSTQAVATLTVTNATGPFTMCPVFDTTTAIITTAVNRKTYWVRIASKPFIQGSRVYFWAYSGSSISPGAAGSITYSLTLLDSCADDQTSAFNVPARPVGTSAPRFSDPQLNQGMPSSAPQLSSTVRLAAGRVNKNNSGRNAAVLLKADFASTEMWSNTTGSELLHLSGGLPSYYDFRQNAEIGFLYGPEVISATSTAGGSMVPGNYAYVITYEWVDQKGNIHRSATSEPFAATVGAGDASITLVAPTYTITTRVDQDLSLQKPILGIYRSLVGAPAGPFFSVYNVTSTQLTVNNLGQTISYVDTQSDTNISQNPTVYTTGGNLDNVCPPSLHNVSSFKTRIVGIGEDKKTLWFTDESVEGEAPSFHDEFTIQLDDGSDLIGSIQMDDKWVIFSETSVYVVFGEGPTPLDTNNDYQLPQKLASDLGCIDARSIVLTQQGVLFQSPVGLYMVDRSLQVSFIGQPVDLETTNNPTITSAITHPSGSYVLFTTGSPRIVYDYRLGKWGTDLVLGRDSQASIISSVSHGGTVYWLDSVGSLFKEDPSLWTDSTQWVTATVEPGWFKPGGLQGYGQIHDLSILCNRYSAHDLKLDVFKDYNDTTPINTIVFSDTKLSLLPFEQVNVSIPFRKGEAVRFKLTLSPPTGGAIVGAGRGASFIGYTYRAAQLEGQNRMGQLQKS